MGIVLDALLFLGYESLSGFISFLLVLLVIRKIQKRKGVPISSYHYFSLLVFSLYVIGVFYFTDAGTIYDGMMYKLELPQNQVNLIPFSRDMDIIGYLLNIALFIPLGLLSPIIWKKLNNVTHIIGAGLFFTVLIETSQLLNNRVTDIDDIILNLLGAVIGFGLFKLWSNHITSKFRIESHVSYELPICIIAIFAGRFFLYNEMGLARHLYAF